MKRTADGSYWIPDGDTFPYWSNQYEKTQFDYVCKRLFRYRKAVDVGAHVGLWSNRLAALFAEVVCFEPVASHIECFKRNCVNPNIVLHEVGLSNRVDRATMNVISAGNTGMSSLERLYGVKSSKVQIPVVPLDSYDLRDVDFLKLDVERHEVQVLQGAVDLLERCKPMVFMEDHSAAKPGSGVAFLESVGYQHIGMPLNKGQNNYLMGHCADIQ